MPKVVAENKKALFDLEITDKLEAGIILTGAEVKSTKHGGANLKGSYIQVVGGKPVAVGLYIRPYEKAHNPDYQPERTRDLLLTKKEIDHLVGALSQKGLTAVPLRLYIKSNLLKLEIGIGKGRKKHDKREVLKRRSIERETAQELKERPGS